MSEPNPFRETGMSRGKTRLELRIVLLIVGVLVVAGVLLSAVYGNLRHERPTGKGTIIDPAAHTGKFGERRPPPPPPPPPRS